MNAKTQPVPRATISSDEPPRHQPRDLNDLPSMKEPVYAEGPKHQPVAFALAVRTQIDRDGDAVSLATALNTGTDTPVRAEYGPSSDINNILKDFNVDQFGRPIRPYEFQEIDYGMDLQQAHMAVDNAKAVLATVPEELRQQYPTWQHVLNATENGQYAADLQALDEKKKKQKEAAAAAAATPQTPVETPKGT